MKRKIQQLLWQLLGVRSILRKLNALAHDIRMQRRSALDLHYSQTILFADRYAEAGRLPRHGYRIYSQNFEDGIIAEIFDRIGCTNQYFVEFGIQDGRECNTRRLLESGWSGMWIEADPEYVQMARRQFSGELQTKRLVLLSSFVTAENIEELFRTAQVPPEPDLLSIDIDGNDYWIWEAISTFRPRVLMIEYNGIWRNEFAVQAYDPKFAWDGFSSNYGASLDALEALGDDKGYALVGCDVGGVNAFFVRRELVGDKFAAPFTAANHYEPPRHLLGHIAS